MNRNARLQQKRLVERLHPRQLAVIRILEHVDRAPARLENADLVGQREIDRGGSNLIAFERLDDESTGIQLFQNRFVGEDSHRAAHGTVRRMSHPYFDAARKAPGPLVLGHRGAAGEAPENTLPSFQLALTQRADILESDVHLTRDGVAVLCHDAELDRTTNGTGPIAQHTADELSQLDAAHHFSLDHGATFPLRGQGIGIPTLEQAFAAFPEAFFNLELKEGGEPLVVRALEQIAAAGNADRTLLTAADDTLMDHLKVAIEAAPRRPALGASTLDVARFVQAAIDGAPPPPGPQALQIPTEFADRPLVTPELIKHAHAHGVEVHVWTIDDEAEMERLLDLGVDGLVTNFPARMRALLLRRSEGR